MKIPKNATPERVAQIRERNRAYKRKSREALYAAGLTATKKQRTISDEAHAARREDSLRREAESRGEYMHPAGCLCYDCLWQTPSWVNPRVAVSGRCWSPGEVREAATPSVENLVRVLEG